MPLHTDIPGVAIQLSRNVVVASIQVDLDDNVLARFRDDLLQRVQESDSRGVILDVSGLETLDADEFGALRQIMKMTAIMGVESILVGMQPGVVSALIETGTDIGGVRAAINLDAGYELLEPLPEPAPDAEKIPPADSEPADGRRSEADDENGDQHVER